MLEKAHGAGKIEGRRYDGPAGRRSHAAWTSTLLTLRWRGGKELSFSLSNYLGLSVTVGLIVIGGNPKKYRN